MKIALGRGRRDGWVLIALFVTMVIFGFIVLLYHVTSQVDNSEQRRRERGATNDITRLLDRLPDNWLVSFPPSANVSYTNGAAYVDMTDEVALDLFASVAQYQIQHATAIGGEWTNTEAQPIWADLQSMRDIMAAFARIDSIVNSNSPMGFYRAVRLP